MSISITAVTPTVFLRRGPQGLEQAVTISVHHDGPEAVADVSCLAGGGECARLTVVPDTGTHEVFVPELSVPSPLAFELRAHGGVVARHEVAWQPPRHWSVHLVHLSHHDVGYTDLPSHVLPQHVGFLRDALRFAADTRDYPEAAQFRLVVEQAWSLQAFFRHATRGEVKAMLELIRAGRVEVTALFGNLTTELCGHETLVRSLAAATVIARRSGVPLVSAEHNDIPGFTWGLAEVLAGAGVKLFCPGLPLYYNWGGGGVPSFWNENDIFGYAGMPGAFWWESQSGGRVLFWCNNTGCGGDCHATLPGLAVRLQQYAERGYPYPVMRWPVSGGARDNSPYSAGYCDTVRDWNRRWAYPHLELSTNARFHEELHRQLPTGLRRWRGDVPGQDYPVGAMSTAPATTVNRRNHAALPAAEILDTAAHGLTGRASQAARLDLAYESVLWHDEHTWGHHFPCGPTCDAHALEKALHAQRAAALAHDVAEKAKAAIADAIHLDHEGLHLVVFNSLAEARTGLVQAPLRELDNCGSEMYAVSAAEDANGPCLRPALLGKRWHVNPPPEIVAGAFTLVDAASGTPVPFQLSDLDSPLVPVPHSAERVGLAGGGKRYGFFEQPSGLKRTLDFVATDVPGLGWRLYRLEPAAAPAPAVVVQAQDATTVAETDLYRVEVSPVSGAVTRILDKRCGRECVGPDAVHPFGAVIVRTPQGDEQMARLTEPPRLLAGPLRQSLVCHLAAPGHPEMVAVLTLTVGQPEIEFSLCCVKDPTPLLEVLVAFPFHVPDGQFLSEEPLRVAAPAAERLPGAYLNRLPTQDWVAVGNAERGVLWSSLDAPIVSLGRLWPNRVSPAHSCVPPSTLGLPPQSAADLRGGTVYALLFFNNCGTNFQVSQSGTTVFRFVFLPVAGPVVPAVAARFGQQAQVPLGTMFTKHPGPRPLPASGGFLTIDNPGVRLLTLRQAANGRDLLLRLWNVTDEPVTAAVALSGMKTGSACRTDWYERDAGNPVLARCGAFTLQVPAHALQTWRCRVRR